MQLVTRFAATLAVCYSIGALATNDHLSKIDILRLAKAEAANYCTHGALGPFPKLGSLTKIGCDYDANFDGKSWAVIAHSLYQDKEGRPVLVQGADRIYVFFVSGKLLQELSGE
ncbi:hypothetical protein [Dyella sp. A6]|uniref:hypothetical protein n=1 Tax=Dyella aluminiiresistens TaxID=3069105 RepID=UPI002E75C7E3|nr:hypothetical protein [Dyella sp. A6]